MTIVWVFRAPRRHIVRTKNIIFHGEVRQAPGPDLKEISVGPRAVRLGETMHHRTPYGITVTCRIIEIRTITASSNIRVLKRVVGAA